MSNLGSGESKLETVISYLLITGVLVSLALVTAGIVIFYRSYGHLNVLLEDKAMFIHGQNFFRFLYELSAGEYTLSGATLFITAGLAVLILTPYLRVVASVLYFAWAKDIKYVLITAFVLLVLTVSLILH